MLSQLPLSISNSSTQILSNGVHKLACTPLDRNRVGGQGNLDLTVILELYSNQSEKHKAIL